MHIYLKILNGLQWNSGMEVAVELQCLQCMGLLTVSELSETR